MGYNWLDDKFTDENFAFEPHEVRSVVEGAEENKSHYVDSSALRIHPANLTAHLHKASPIYEHAEVVEGADIYPLEMFRFVHTPAGLLVDATYTQDCNTYVGGKVIASAGIEIAEIDDDECLPVGIWIDNQMRLEEIENRIAEAFGVYLGDSAIKLFADSLSSETD